MGLMSDETPGKYVLLVEKAPGEVWDVSPNSPHITELDALDEIMTEYEGEQYTFAVAEIGFVGDYREAMDERALYWGEYVTSDGDA